MADEGLFGGGAAFGVYPQMGGRRRLQDPQASADVPFQGFRGSVAGLLGLLPDVANFMGRSPMPTEALGEFDYGPRQQLPYGSEFYLKELPLAPTSPVGQLAGQVGSFVPLSPMPAIRGAQTVGRMVGQRMAENVAMGRPNLPSMFAEPRTSLFAVEPSPMAAPKPQAPVSELGFYSAAEQAAMNLQRGKGTGQSFLNDLMKASDVKKDELQYTGLDEFLKDKPNVTRQEVQDFIAGNRVDVQERQLGGALSPEMQTTRDALNDKYKGLVDNIADAKSQFEEGKISYAQVRNTVSNNQVQIQALDTQINEINKTISPTKYEQFQLPGGENYREILLKLPQKPQALPEGFNVDAYSVNGVTKYGVYDANGQRYGSGATKEEALQRFGELHQDKLYQSSHFNEPNILAHMRVNDRIDADGKKMLLVEEVQSDWHQAGREKGYNTPEKRAAEQKKLDDLLLERQQLGERQKQLEELASPYTSQGKDAPRDILDEWNSVSNRLNRLQTEQNRLGRSSGEGVPDAPFKDTWYQLALKRALKEAVDKGYDRIGLTTGAQQAERYNLAKQVDEVIAKRNPDGSFNLDVTLVGGGTQQSIGKNIASDKLADYVGKDLAKTMQNQTAGTDVYSGDALKVGGEGMKKYYDEIYPAFLNKQGKKYGAQVGETRLERTASKDDLAAQVYGRGETYKNLPSENKRKIDRMYLGSNVSIRYLDITPEMRKAVQKGQPLFAAAPVGALTASEFDYTDPFGNTIGESIR